MKIHDKETNLTRCVNRTQKYSYLIVRKHLIVDIDGKTVDQSKIWERSDLTVERTLQVWTI